MLRFVRTYHTSILTFVLIVIALFAFLWGYGIWRQPNITVSCGAIDLQIPTKYLMEMMMIKLLLVSEEKAKHFTENMRKELKKLGMEENKAQMIIEAFTAEKEEDKKVILSKIDNLEVYEQNIVKIALTKASMGLLESIMRSMIMPRAVLFFDIKNNGWVDAKNARIVIRLNGSGYSMTLDTDNKILSKRMEGNRVVIELAAIAPNSKTRAILWYSGYIPSLDEQSKISTDALEENEISVTFENGTVRKRFTVDSFYLGE